MKSKKSFTPEQVKKAAQNIGYTGDLNVLHRGMIVESEHPDVTKGSPTVTARIAAAHIKESRDYYKELAKMEKKLEKKVEKRKK